MPFQDLASSHVLSFDPRFIELIKPQIFFNA